MTLQPIDASGSQRYTPPPAFTAPDVRQMIAPAEMPVGMPPIAGIEFIKPIPIKGTPFLYGKATLHDARGPFIQYGDGREHGASRSSGHAVGDAPDILRLPFGVARALTPDPAASPFRMTHAEFINDAVIATLNSSTQALYRPTSTTNPAITTVTGFTNDGATAITCLLVTQFSGVHYLLIGYANKNGGTSTLQALADLNNPPTSSYVPSGSNAIWGMATRADGVVMLYYKNRIGLIETSAVTPATSSITDVATVVPGGYGVGVQSLGGAPPLFYFVEPKETFGSSLVLYFDPTLPATRKGVLKAVTQDGETVSYAATSLPWVTFVTPVVLRGAQVRCDQTTHEFDNGRRREPLTFLSGRVVEADYQIVCRGHYTDGQRFWWLANRIKSGVATQSWLEEVDLDRGISLPCSEPTTIGVDAQSVAGWDLPYMDTHRQNVHYTDGAWYEQKQRKPYVPGFDLRMETSLGSGFDTPSYAQWPVLTYPGLENYPMITARITAPYNRSIRAGEATAGTASVTVEEMLSGVGATFHGRGPDERRPSREFPTNRSWSRGWQPKVTLVRDPGTSFATPNGLPDTFEFIALREDLPGVNLAQYRNLDATAMLRRVAG